MVTKLRLSKYTSEGGFKQVQIYYSHKGRIYLDTGVKTLPEYWMEDHIDMKAKIIGQDPTKLNLIIKQKRSTFDKILVDHQLFKGYLPSTSYVKERYDQEALTIENKYDVKILFKEWIERKKKKIKDVKIYQTVLNNLNDFHSKPLYFEDINNVFLDNLVDHWLSDLPRIQNSTIKKRLSRFKTFLRAMVKEGKNDNETFDKFRSELTDKRKHVIIIPTDEEFNSLVTVKILDKRLDYARDLFLLGCTTGLRYSDVIRLSGNNIKVTRDKKYIEMNIQKTGDYLRIPLNDVAEDILKKNGYTLKMLSNQKLNDALHDLFKHLGFDSIETTTERYGSRTNVVTKPKHEIMSMHDSRRFFLSVCMNTAGVSAANVMEWSGHKNLKTLQRYIKQGMNQEEQMRKVFNLRKFKLVKIYKKKQKKR